MRSRTIPMVLIALCLCALCQSVAFAQGGWDVWTIQLRDGTKLEVAPVWSLDKTELRYGMAAGGAGKGTPVARSRIDHMSNNLGNSEYRASMGASYLPPALPENNSDEDVVIMDDGRRVEGPVIIRAGTNKSGGAEIYRPVLVQKGVETDLTKVAHIKFAASKNSTKDSRPRHP
jgi:hypothetical protein